MTTSPASPSPSTSASTTSTTSPPLDPLDAQIAADVAHLLGVSSIDSADLDPTLLDALHSHRNSAEAHGERLARYLQHLIDHPVTRMVDRSDLYRALLPHCDRLSPLQAYTMRNLMGAASNPADDGTADSIGYPPMPPEVHLEFPRDDRVDATAQCSWHFLVGSLWDDDGQEYGLEMMIFDQAMYPPPFARELGLSPIDNLAVEVQFAISVRGERHHQAEPLVTMGTSGLVRTESSPFAFGIGASSFESDGPDALLPMRVRSVGTDRGGDAPLQLACDLHLTPGKGVLEQGDHGAMPSAGGLGTFYYSIPMIGIDAANSTITIDGRTIRIARGELWFDHQWGFLAGAAPVEVVRASNSITRTDPAGWDWFMMHLDGNRQVTVFAPHTTAFESFYGCTDDTAPPEMVRRVGGTYMDVDGSTSMVWGTMHVDRWVKVAHTPNPQRYPATNTWYPDHYRFEFPADDAAASAGLPDDIAQLTLTPIVEGGQSAFFAHGIQICEGSVVIRNATGDEVGRGFAEAVAFADTTRNQLRLAGLPVTEELLELVADPTPSSELAASNTEYVANHQDALAQVVLSAKGLNYFMEPGAAAAPASGSDTTSPGTDTSASRS